MKETRFKIKGAEIILVNKGENQGEIQIKGKTKGSFSMYWGAMGGTIEDFMVKINSDYFSSKLLGSINSQVFCEKETFKNLRQYIKENIDFRVDRGSLFRKDLNKVLRDFQRKCKEHGTPTYFIESFEYNLSIIDFYLIEERYDKCRMREDFVAMSGEPWLFIGTKESDTSKWLKTIHAGIKRKLKQ